MSTVDSYLKALLALSGNEQLATPRQHLLQGINDDDLSELLKKVMGREFARGGLEDIVSVILDVIARDPASVNGDGGCVATASVKSEQPHGDDIQQSSAEDEIITINNDPGTGQPAIEKRPTPSSSGTQIRKRSRPNKTPVAATQAPSARKVTLRCSTEQVIDDKTVPPIEIVYYKGWDYDDMKKRIYLPFVPESNLGALIIQKFDKDFLSTDRHVSEWGKLLRLRDRRIDKRCCVNFQVAQRSDMAIGATRETEQACRRCVDLKRLCARLLMIDGVVKLVFLPLPYDALHDVDADDMEYWVSS